MYGTFIIETRAAKGGTGKTTLACAISLFSQQHNGQTLLVTDQTGDAAGILGMGQIPEGYNTAAHTSGLLVMQTEENDKRYYTTKHPEINFIVTDLAEGLKGGTVQDNTATVWICPPAYLAVRRFTKNNTAKPQHLYTYPMAGAPLTTKDVKSVLQPKEMTLEGAWSPDIARAIDAGIFDSRFTDGASIYKPITLAAAKLWDHVMSTQGADRGHAAALRTVSQ